MITLGIDSGVGMHVRQTFTQRSQQQQQQQQQQQDVSCPGK
jgi:hypothetical protein